MSIQNYSTVASRNLIRAAQGMLDHAAVITVLGNFGDMREHPQRATDTIVFRRTLPLGASAAGTTIENSPRYVGTPNINATDYVLAEGTTPNAQTVTFQDVSVTLQPYGILFKFSSRTELLYEDDVPAEMVKICGEGIAEILEKVRYGVMRAGSTVIYANGSSRASVNSTISLNSLRRAARTLRSNRSMQVTTRLAAGPNFGTRAVQPAYVVFCHTDAMADIRNLPGFTKVEEYGQFKPVDPTEFGACEEFRFLASPLFASFAGAGSATLNGCLSVGGSAVDVYPFIVIGDRAWGQIALAGKRSLKPTILSSQQTNHANPLGQFGYVGVSTWFNAVRLNEAWCARIEAGVSAL